MRGQHIHRCVAVPGRLELPTFGLGNRCSIRLSYGTARGAMYHRTGAEVIRFRGRAVQALRREAGCGVDAYRAHFPGLMPASVTIRFILLMLLFSIAPKSSALPPTISAPVGSTLARISGDCSAVLIA
jgi:hypothetical protein